MNNIYVDELPKSCKDCSFQCYGSCLGGRDILNGNPYTGICHLKRQKPTDCPLKPLTDRLAEERKKVVQEIKTLLKEYVDIDVDIDYKDCNYQTITDYGLKKILDQIERKE